MISTKNIDKKHCRRMPYLDTRCAVQKLANHIFAKLSAGLKLQAESRLAINARKCRWTRAVACSRCVVITLNQCCGIIVSVCRWYDTPTHVA